MFYKMPYGFGLAHTTALSIVVVMLSSALSSTCDLWRRFFMLPRPFDKLRAVSPDVIGIEPHYVLRK
jgi:hypothetical protein